MQRARSLVAPLVGALLLTTVAHAGDRPSPIAHDPAASPPPPTQPAAPPTDETATDPPAGSGEDGASAAAMRIAVYDFEVDDVDERTARVLTDSVLFEVRKLARVSAIGMNEIAAMLDLEAQKQLVGCSEEDSCLADIAGALGVDGLVIGAVARVGGEHVFTLKRIDQRRATTVGNVTKRLAAGNGEELLAVVGDMVAEVFPDHELRPGTTRGVDAEVGRRLNPPPLPPWVFWTGVGTTSVLVVSAGLAGAGWGVLQSDYSALAERSASEVVDGATLKELGGRAQTAEIAGWSLVGSAVLVGAVTGVLAAFTDFYGYGEDDS
jgi:hypothetical protein